MAAGGVGGRGSNTGGLVGSSRGDLPPDNTGIGHLGNAGANSGGAGSGLGGAGAGPALLAGASGNVSAGGSPANGGGGGVMLSCDAGTYWDGASCQTCRDCGSLALVDSCAITHDTVCQGTNVVDYWGAQGVGDLATAVAVDHAGNVWVTGYVGASLTETDTIRRGSFLREYPNGSLPAVDLLDTDSGYMPVAIAIDRAGNVWVGGYTGGPSGYDYDAFVRKYPVDGSAPLLDQFGTTRDEQILALAADASGNVWATGFTNADLVQTSAGSNDVIIRKYAADGSAPVTTQFGWTGPDDCDGIAVDPAGNVWVTGSTFVDDQTNPHYGAFDTLVRKYPADGSAPFTDKFGSPARDEPMGIAVDGAGNAWVAGYTDGNLAMTSLGGRDAYIRKYPADGSAPSTEQFGGPGDDVLAAITRDSAGNIWVTGWLTDQSGAAFAFVREYPVDGSASRTDKLTDSRIGSFDAIAAGNGSLWLAGGTPWSDALLFQYAP